MAICNIQLLQIAILIYYHLYFIKWKDFFRISNIDADRQKKSVCLKKRKMLSIAHFFIHYWNLFSLSLPYLTTI